MTVVATLISKHGVVHVSDSLRTKLTPGGKREALEWERSKIVAVKSFRGAISYWGLDSCGEWSTFDWLKRRALDAGRFESAETFAQDLARSLQFELGRIRFRQALDRGIGMHFAAYERIAERQIPELFLITNFRDPTYGDLMPGGPAVSRETYHYVGSESPRPEHRDPECRLAVHRYLHDIGVLQFNNGDPGLFNMASRSIFDSIQELDRRRILRRADEPETWRLVARRPVEIVSAIQADFCEAGHRIVGGRVHDLVITPTGEYSFSGSGRRKAR